MTCGDATMLAGRVVEWTQRWKEEGLQQAATGLQQAATRQIREARTMVRSRRRPFWRDPDDVPPSSKVENATDCMRYYGRASRVLRWRRWSAAMQGWRMPRMLNVAPTTNVPSLTKLRPNMNVPPAPDVRSTERHRLRKPWCGKPR
jgi:hypothetical protein